MKTLFLALFFGLNVNAHADLIGHTFLINDIKFSRYAAEGYFINGFPYSEDDDRTRATGPTCQVNLVHGGYRTLTYKTLSVTITQIKNDQNSVQKALGINTGSVQISVKKNRMVESISCWTQGYQTEPTEQDIRTAFGSHLVESTHP